MRRGRNFFRRFSLRIQIILAFLAVALLALSLLALFYIRTTRAALTGQANQALFAAASRTATSIETFIEAKLDTIRTEAGLPQIVAYMSLPAEERKGSSEEAIVAQTLSILRNEDLFYISSYALLDEKGQNILDTNIPEIGIDESMHDYFQVPMQNGLPFVSSVEFAQDVGGVYFYFSSPVRNEVGQITGVLRVRYSVALLQELVSESHGLAGENSYAILLDSNLLRLAQDAAPELIFKTVVPLDSTERETLKARNSLPNLSEPEGSTNLPDFAVGVKQADNIPYFTAVEQIGNGRVEQMAVVPLQAQDWVVVYAQPQAVFLATIESAIRVTLVWTIIVTLLLLLAAIIISRWLTRPVIHLTAVADKITAGDLTAQATVESGDEIGRLAQAFNNMTSQLRQTLEGLEKREEALQATNTQLEATLLELQETQAQMVQQERVAAVGQLAAGIAHDFNNLMATVILYSDTLLKSDRISAADKERILTIQQQGQRAAELTQQILDFSRKSMLKRQDLEVWPFLLEIRNLLARTMPENIQLSLDCQVREVMINADPTRLQQVILNLAINARNAMSNGGKLHISLASLLVEPGLPPPIASMSPGHWMKLTIADSGTGIDEAVLNHIFEPFFTTRAPLGSGLGLSQVDGIIKQHGGHIRVETQVGVGTSFHIYLPALPKTAVATAVDQPLPLAKGQGETILLVEDDRQVREALTHSLESLHYHVLSAANGREGLTLYRQQSQAIDLVVSDLVMPELSGKELLAILKRTNPTLKAIVLTGYPLSGQEGELRSLGAVGWCQKPVTLEKLSQVVAQALARKPVR